MGLCKCPKRKTTSHFCFYHCVNVCEYCIINNHTTCIVKSYTTWLKEASGSNVSSVSSSALCAVCQKQFVSPEEFENVTTKTAIRLLCYHVMHARCLSVYVKNQFKENKSFKCPSCAWPLWVQQQISSDSNDTIQPDLNELSPVALQLYKHLLNHGKWWGQVLIKNTNINDIEKHLFEDDYEDTAYENAHQLEIKPQTNNAVSNDISLLLAPAQTIPNNKHCFNDYNNSELLHTESNLTMNHRNNTPQTHHRHINDNYDINSISTHQQQSFVNISQDSDLSNEYLIKPPPLLLNNDSSYIYNEKQDPNGKYKPKKFNSYSWTSSYQRLIQYFCGMSAEDNTSKRTTIIILCILITIIVLLITITSYTRSHNEPFDNNSIDYAGEHDDQNIIGSSKLNFKSYNINNNNNL